MRLRRSVLLIFITFTFAGTCLQAQDYGLFFASYDSLKDKRTGISMFPEKCRLFKDNFELSFDIDIHETRGFNFGYVFRAIFNEDHNVDMLYRLLDGREIFTIVTQQEQTEITYGAEQILVHDPWINLRIQFLLTEDKIIFHCQDDTMVHENAGLKHPARVKLFFGANYDSRYATTDVPPIKLRDIKIKQKSKTRYHWPLDEVRGETAREIIKQQHAKVVNPEWLKMRHMKWDHIQHIQLGGYAKIIANQENNTIYLLGNNRLITFDVMSGSLDTLSISEDPFLFKSHYQGVFDGKQILSYNQNSQQLIKIDPLSGNVQNNILSPTTRKSFLHHNKYLDTINNLLHVLNGYGHYTYSNALILCNTGNNEWSLPDQKGDVYPPRYLAASGFLNDTIYILGGYGSSSGDQRLNPQYFYDFNTISLESFEYAKKWEYAQPENDFCFANSLVIDSISRNFYTLSFPKHKFESQLQLIQGSIDRPELVKIGAPIPYLFNDINSYADLFYFSAPGKLVAVTMYTKDYTNSAIELYSINFPPLKETISEVDDPKAIIYIMSLVMVLIVAGTLLVFLKRRKKYSEKLKPTQEIPLDKSDTAVTKNAMFFFGGFQVLNRDGKDITKKFTRLLKELFLFILFKSTGNSSGISSERLIELLWFDKDAKSGRNNLSVNIAKLKDILKEVDGCKLDHETGYWKLIFDRKQLFVEYLEIQKVFEKEENTLTIASLTTLLRAANNGQFLVNLDYEWLDRYKGQVSDMIVDRLISYAESLDPKTESSLIIQIANSVFNFDTVNEEAMVLKCRTQTILGKHSLSMKTYEDFCKEYELLYGECFKRPFISIINEA